MIMRIKFTTVIKWSLILINVAAVYYVLRLNFFGLTPQSKCQNNSVSRTFKSPTSKLAIKHLSKLVTIIIQEFELNDNDVTLTVKSFLNVFPSIEVLVLCSGIPYPPLDLTRWNSSFKNVKLIDTSLNLNVAYFASYSLVNVKTKYVLFVPDSTRIQNRQSVQAMLSHAEKTSADIVAAPVNVQHALNCLKIDFSAREWTVKYESIKEMVCDAVSGKHVALVRMDVLRKLPNAFLVPFPQSLYLQTSNFNVKVYIIKNTTFQDGKPVLRSHHAVWERQQLDIKRREALFNLLKIKQVITDRGTQWYGCNKETPRCFGSIIDSMPSYLYEGKWTPPCCLANLRKTALYVFSYLDEVGIRYWLEGGSLLGAMRSGDILPWDHDVDVGVYSLDVVRAAFLSHARDKPVTDTKGFVWEKATEGNFFRVHYSKINRIHVNIFPFLVKNGTMSKDSWFTGHRNMEFPERFLHPMSSIEFLGRHVPSPNNIVDFLELKYGKGAVENPRYPNPARMRFP